MASRSYLHRTMRMASLISDSWSEEKEGRWCRISQINCSFMVSSVFEDMIPDLGVISELSNNLKSSFQAGVDALYNKCRDCGATPSSKTPTAISSAIGTVYTNRYNDGYSAGNAAGYNTGRTQGQNDVKANPNAYGLYSKAQYDAGLNWVSYTSPGTSFSYNLGFNPRILLVLYDSGSGSGYNIFAYYDSINNITAGSTPYCARTANGFNWNYGSAGRPVKIGYRQ